MNESRPFKFSEFSFDVEIDENRSLGAVVSGIDVSHLKSADIGPQIRKLLLQRLVVVIRGQTISPNEQLNFAQKFGVLNDFNPKEYGESDLKGIIYVSNTKQGGHLGCGDVIWHSDSSFYESPPSFTFLFAENVPDNGGQTSWVDMYEAFRNTPVTLLDQFKKLTVRHDNLYNAVKQPRQLLIRATTPIPPGASHPLIGLHAETGRPFIYIGRVERNIIEGRSELESRHILGDILDRAIGNPNAVWEHDWKQGDLAIWDNRCTMHRRKAFAANQSRVMRRCEVFQS